MITHETPGMELPTGYLAGFTKGIEEAAAILIVVENGFTPVRAIHQVVDGPGKLNAQRSRHGVSDDTSVSRDCQLLELTPL